MTECLWEYLCKLYTDTMPFHIKVLSSQGLWNSQKPWSQFPLDTEELVSGYHQIMIAWFILSLLLIVSVLNIFFHSLAFFSQTSLGPCLLLHLWSACPHCLRREAYASDNSWKDRLFSA